MPQAVTPVAVRGRRCDVGLVAMGELADESSRKRGGGCGLRRRGATFHGHRLELAYLCHDFLVRHGVPLPVGAALNAVLVALRQGQPARRRQIQSWSALERYQSSRCRMRLGVTPGPLTRTPNEGLGDSIGDG